MSGSVRQQRIDDVESGIRQFQEKVNADYARFSPADPLDFGARRRAAEEVRKPWTSGGPEMAATTDLKVGPMNVPIRIYNPTGAADLPALIYIHGGGWTLFSVDTHDRLMREYAARAGIAVVGIDYSLSPEVKFPVPVQEIASVIRWLRSPESGRHLRAGRIAIGGDSAGANLAIAANLALREAGEPLLDAVLLNYGAFDTEFRHSHARYGGDEYMLTPDEMADFWNNYLGREDHENPMAKPLRADLKGMPPAFICIAECDILADENREMAARLRDAGVPVHVESYAGATHSFLEAMSVSALADRALDDASHWLSGVLRR